jgi:hypothetical protein
MKIKPILCGGAKFVPIKTCYSRHFYPYSGHRAPKALGADLD